MNYTEQQIGKGVPSRHASD